MNDDQVNTTISENIDLQMDHKASSISCGLVWSIVGRLVGVVLLTAAVLKGRELATRPLLGKGLLGNRWLLMAIVEFEVTFGAWLLFGFYPRWTRRIAIGVFTVFSCVVLFQAFSGAESCGCFGRVQVNPWYTAGFDLCATIALIICRVGSRPIPATRHFHRWRWAGFATVSLVTLVFGTWTMARYQPARPDGDGVITTGRVVILEPETWIGKRFPLEKYIDIGPELMKGKWIVVLYSWDCEHCRRAVPRYVHLAERNKPMGGLPAVALIEIPPFAPPGQELVANGSAAVLGKLSGNDEWFVSTPVRIDLSNGKVVLALEGGLAELSDASVETHRH